MRLDKNVAVTPRPVTMLRHATGIAALRRGAPVHGVAFGACACSASMQCCALSSRYGAQKYCAACREGCSMAAAARARRMSARRCNQRIVSCRGGFLVMRPAPPRRLLFGSRSICARAPETVDCYVVITCEKCASERIIITMACHRRRRAVLYGGPGIWRGGMSEMAPIDDNRRASTSRRARRGNVASVMAWHR